MSERKGETFCDEFDCDFFDDFIGQSESPCVTCKHSAWLAGSTDDNRRVTKAKGEQAMTEEKTDQPAQSPMIDMGAALAAAGAGNKDHGDMDIDLLASAISQEISGATSDDIVKAVVSLQPCTTPCDYDAEAWVKFAERVAERCKPKTQTQVKAWLVQLCGELGASI